jgi:hypothetical protein
MTQSDIITAYQDAISSRAQAATGQVEHRLMLDACERKLKLYEAEILLGGACDGKNAEERAAKLLQASAESEECRSLRHSIEQERRAVAKADREVVEQTELCRLLRLQLALCVPVGIRELVA